MFFMSHLCPMKHMKHSEPGSACTTTWTAGGGRWTTRVSTKMENLSSEIGHLRNRITIKALNVVQRCLTADYGMTETVMPSVMQSAFTSQVRTLNNTEPFKHTGFFCDFFPDSASICLHVYCFYLFQSQMWHLSSSKTWWHGRTPRASAELITPTWPVWETCQRTRR